MTTNVRNHSDAHSSLASVVKSFGTLEYGTVSNSKLGTLNNIHVKSGALVALHDWVRLICCSTSSMKRWQMTNENLPAPCLRGEIAADESIAWLRQFVARRSEVNSEVLFAIVAHGNDAAYDVIDRLLTERN